MSMNRESANASASGLRKKGGQTGGGSAADQSHQTDNKVLMKIGYPPYNARV